MVRNKRTSNMVNSHICLLEKVVLTSAQAILPIYQTTQAAVLYRESHLWPPEIELNLISQTFVACTARLDPRHPLHTWADRIAYTRHGITHLACLVLALPKAESVNPIAYPPWSV